MIPAAAPPDFAPLATERLTLRPLTAEGAAEMLVGGVGFRRDRKERAGRLGYNLIVPLVFLFTITANAGECPLHQLNPLLPIEDSLFRHINTYAGKGPGELRHEVPQSEIMQPPYSAVVLFEDFKNNWRSVIGGCTGSIVKDPHILVVNAHCLLSEPKGLPPVSNELKAVFYFGTKAQELVVPELCSMGTQDSKRHLNQDYAVLYIPNPPPNIVPFKIRANEMGGPGTVTQIQNIQYTTDLKSDGILYSQSCKFHPSIQNELKQDGYQYNYITHDCDTWEGSSGSPLFFTDPKTGEHIIIGVNQGMFTSTNINLAKYGMTTTNLGVETAQFAPAIDACMQKHGLPTANGTVAANPWDSIVAINP